MEEFTQYEKARILGARALQIAMDAPILLKIDKKELENLKYNPLKIAELELDADVLPITVRRPMPKKKEGKLKKVKKKEEEEKKRGGKDEEKIEEIKEEKEKIEKEEKEEEQIREEGEIMELAKPEDELEEEIEAEEEKEEGI